MRFKKKRKPGPSKNQKKVARRAQDDAGPDSPVLGRLLPGVSSLTIAFSITSPQNELVKEENISFKQNEPVELSCACPGTCGVGKFDLSEKVAAMVEAQETEGEASGACQMEGFGGIPEPCGYIMHCRINIAYI